MGPLSHPHTETRSVAAGATLTVEVSRRQQRIGFTHE